MCGAILSGICEAEEHRPGDVKSGWESGAKTRNAI